MESQTNLLSSEASLDSRADIEFLPLPTEETGFNGITRIPEEDNEEEDYDPTPSGSTIKFDLQREPVPKPKNAFKDCLSFALSVFNLMNVILGSGILGLAEVVKNLGVALFTMLLVGTAILASYQINILLHCSNLVGVKTYEGLANLSFGLKGKVATSIMIILHCFGAMISYIFIIKNELPEVIRALVNYTAEPGESVPYYFTGDFVALLVLLLVISPLSMLKDIRFLGYSSAFGMICMFFFTITVIVKKFSIPCPLPLDHFLHENVTDPYSTNLEIDSEQVCQASSFTLNSRSAYAIPTMVFAFMCHASMLPIYSELRRPSIKKMQKVANVSIFNIFILYYCTALFGYLTFFNGVQSELLLSYSLYNSKDPLVIIARMMVIICVTFSVPLLHYPARKSVILTFFRRPLNFSWIRHIGVTMANLVICGLLVYFVPNIRNIFGLSGATSSTCLLIIFPSGYFISLIGNCNNSKVREQFRLRVIAAWVMVVVGTILMIVSTLLIIVSLANVD